MESHKENSGYPFELITGSGLGQPRQAPTGLLPHRPFGRAKLDLKVNTVTGNLLAKDRLISIPDKGGPIEFSYVYNSLANEPASTWKFSFGRSIKLASATSLESYLKVEEADGHETNYILKEGRYYSSESHDATPYIEIDKDKNGYKWYDPQSKITEFFDKNGRLTKLSDASGNETLYQYNAAGEIQEIFTASGIRYEIKRSGQFVRVIQIDTNKKETLLHSYEFENEQLKTSSTGDGYEIHYSYDDSKQLASINQSDGSTLQFRYYSPEETNKNKIKTIQVGDEEFSKQVNTFNYDGDTSTFMDTNGVTTTLKVDAEKKLRIFFQAAGEEKEATSYEYNAKGQVSKIIYPDLSEERFEYEEISGLLAKHISREQVCDEFVYADVGGHRVEVAEIHSALDASKKSSPRDISRCVYTLSEKGAALLRYKISPDGRVKEYTYNESGLVASEYEYYDSKDRYLHFDTIPTLLDMELWKKECDCTARRNVTRFDYNEQGRLKRKIQCLELDENFEGKDSDNSPEIKYDYDHLGHCTNVSVKQSSVKSDNQFLESESLFTQTDDLLQKSIGVKSTLSQITKHDYKLNATVSTYPNKRVVVSTKDSRDLVSDVTDRVADTEKERKYQYQKDASGSINVTVLPDGNKSLSFYDKQNRLKFKVTPEGSVTQFDYSKRYRYRKTTSYSKKVDISTITKMSDLEKIGIDDTRRRESYEFFGLNDKLSYAIDAENYLTEYQYDSLGNLTKQISYSLKINAAELDQLKLGKKIVRAPSRESDQILSYFFDRDGNIIAEQNALGYIIHYERNSAGHILKKIQYAKPCKKLAENVEEILPTKITDEDAQHYYFYNAVAQCVLEVDAEGYITTRNYNPDGQKQATIRYETPVDANWTNKTIPPIPFKSTKGNDEETAYFYDDLGRNTIIKKSNGEVIRYAYDEMNHLVESVSEDANKESKQGALGDFYRAAEYHYDGWSQLIAELDPLAKEQKALFSKIMGEDDSEKKKDTLPEKFTRNFYNEMGLKVKSINPLGHPTVFYYSLDGHLLLTIDPTGAIVEKGYNAFGEIIDETYYYNRIPLSNLSRLQGGYIDVNVKAFIQKEAGRDATTVYNRDHRGQIIESIDPESYVRRFTYNAFKQCEYEQLPISEDKTLEVFHRYDMSGQEIRRETLSAPTLREEMEDLKSELKSLDPTKTKPSLKKQSIVVEKQYEHFLGKVTEVKNELGARTKIRFDKLGRPIKIDKEVLADQFITDKKLLYDAFHRVLSETNADEKITTIHYDQKTLSKTIHSPVADNIETSKENIFGDVIEHWDGEGNVIVMKHAADSQVIEKKEGGSVSITQYNILGLKTEEIDEEKIKTHYYYNEAKQLIRKTFDTSEKGLNLEEKMLRDSFGRAEVEIDARGIKTAKEYNRCSYLIKEIKDLDGRASIIEYTRDAKGNELSRITGDKKTRDQLYLATEYDLSNFISAKIIDPIYPSRSDSLPEALDIRSEFLTDAKGNITREKDPNGNLTYHYYNLDQKKIFSLKPFDETKSALIEWTYTSTGQVAQVRSYHKAVNTKEITSSSTLEDIKRIALRDDKNDSIVQYIYDANDRELFNITIIWNAEKKLYQSIVAEKQYDKANRVIQKSIYSTALESLVFPQWSLRTLQKAITLNTDQDQIIHYWYDAKSKVRFTIDQDGMVNEKRYDRVGRLIEEVTYANPFYHWEDKSLTELEDALQKNANRLKDHVSFKIYDSVGREIFHVKPDGAAEKKDYDESGNVIRVCKYKDRVERGLSYEEVVSLLKTRIANPKEDSITEITVDTLGHVTRVTDALGYQDHFERNVLGYLVKHTDRSNQVWQYQHDRAGRLVKEISPPTLITVPTKTSSGISFVEAKTTVSKETLFDNIGNTTRITEGIVDKSVLDEKYIEPRTLDIKSNPQSKITGTRLPGVLIDDESKRGSLTVLPEKSATLETKTIWDMKGNKLVEIDEAGIANFNVYDNANRLIFSIDREGYVTRYRYNSYDQPIQILMYATQLENLDKFYNTGITQDTLFEKMDLKTSPDDRIKDITYDRSGRLTNIKTGPVYYYSDGERGVAQPETKKEFNHLADCTVEYRLISPGKWSSKYTWYDPSERVIAEVDENNYLTLFRYNVLGKRTLKKEFDKALSKKPTVSTPVEDLEALVELSPLDRTYTSDYDQLGQKLSETIWNVTTDYLEVDEKTSIPSLKTKESQSLTQAWKYSPTEKQIMHIYEDGSKEQTYYDERGIKIAETKVSRTSVLSSGGKALLTPLTVFKVNAFGEAVVTQTSNKGCLPPDDKGTLPDLILTALLTEEPAQLVQTISVYDRRGLVKVKQDPRKNITGFTYTPSRKVARELHEVSTFKRVEASPVVETKLESKEERKLLAVPQGKVSFIKEKHTDESRYKYDKCGRAIYLSRLRDNYPERSYYSRFNAFGELTGESIDAKSWDKFTRMDHQGHPWFTYDKTGGTIRLYDLRGAETLQLQSTDMDLRSINYNTDELSNLLSIESKSLERTETIRDAASHAVARKFPIWFRDKKPLPTRSYKYNRWNMIREKDSLGYETDYEYTYRDQIKRITYPEISVVQTIGDKVIVDEEKQAFPRKRPMKLYGHNERGFKVGVTDANEHTHGDILDEAGQSIVNVLANGVVTRQVFDVLGRVMTSIDARGKQWQYHYDVAGNLFWEQQPLKQFDRAYEYDELNRRSADMDALGRTTRYNYDTSGNITDRFLPLGQCTSTSWDHNDLEIAVKNPDGEIIRYDRNYFGIEMRHSDIEGRITVFEYNYKNEPIKQYLVSGMQWGSVEVSTPVVYQTTDTRHEFPAVTFVPRIFSSPPKYIAFNYSHGLLESVEDRGLSKKISYQHDTEGRPTQVEVKALSPDQTLLYRIVTDYDELGREHYITEERLSDKLFLSTTKAMLLYDAASNNRNMDITTTASGYSAGCTVTKRRTYWNLFDDADYLLICNGSVSSERRILLMTDQGFELKYDKGFRIGERRIEYGVSVEATISYDDSGFLRITNAYGPRPVSAECSFSDVGVLDYYAETFDGKKIVTKARFNENAWQLDEVITDSSYPGGVVSTLTTLESFQCGLSKVESLHDVKNAFTDTRRNTYFRTDAWNLAIVNVTRTSSSGTSPEINAQFLFDANGFLTGKIDSADEPCSQQTPVVHMDTLPHGWLMNKQCILYRANRQTNYLRSATGKLLGGYTSGYMDTQSPAPRGGILKMMEGLVNPKQVVALEAYLSIPTFPTDGVILSAMNKGMMYFLNRKILRDPSGNPLYTGSNISLEDFNALPFEQVMACFWKANRDLSPWLFDKVIDLALQPMGASQAFIMQKNHFAYHTAGIGQDIRPDVGDFVMYSPVHPLARIYPTDPTGRNNPLDWDEPHLMNKMGLNTYIVTTGDTFKSISKKFGGDSRDALKIARSNGFAAHTLVPKPGLMLRIPQIITSKSNLKTSRPDHDFMRVVGGSLSPLIKTPHPPRIVHRVRKKKRSFWGFILKIVAVTLVCLAAPHLAAAILPLAGIAATTTAVAMTTSVVAAIGDAAAQGLAMKLEGGRFSFTEMFETGFTAGVMQIPLGETVASQALKIGTAAVSAQLAEMATGARSHFDPTAIITQVSSAVIASSINTGIDGLFKDRTALAYAAKSITTPVTEAVMGHVVTHTPMDVKIIAANALGTSIGTKLGESAIEAMRFAKPVPSATRVEIDVSDPKWSRELSDLSSRQRQERALKLEASDKGRSYLLDDQRQSKYRQMMFSDMKPSESSSTFATPKKTATWSEKHPFLSRMPDMVRTSHTVMMNALKDFGAEAKTDIIELAHGDFAAKKHAAIDLGEKALVAATALMPFGRASAVESVAIGGARVVEGSAGGLGIFGSRSTINFEAQNHISGLRLQQQLAIEEQRALFNWTGGLTKETIKNSRLMIPGDDLGNTKLINELTRRPGNLSDWGKYVTDPIHTPSGKAQIHFYYNPVTNDIYYGRDYKSIFDHQGTWNMKQTPNFDYEQLRLR